MSDGYSDSIDYEFVVAKRCGNAYTGYLLPGQRVQVNRVILNTVTNRMKADVWSAETLNITVPVNNIVGLMDAVRTGRVRVVKFTPGIYEWPDDDAPLSLR